MAGRGAAPKPEARHRHPLTRGNPTSKETVGWQHGRRPEPPKGLSARSRETWRVWFDSWFAAHWGPEDLPGLRVLIQVHDAVVGGDLTRANELRLQMDTYGITPKGQQDRRWVKPADDAPAKKGDKPQGDYRKLRVV